MSFERSIGKTYRSIEKLCNKVNRSLEAEYYVQPEFNNSMRQFNHKMGAFYLMTDNQLMREVRNEIVQTLNDIDYRRKDKWTRNTQVGFITEMLKLDTLENDTAYKDDYIKDISKRYNIPVNRLKCTMTVFLLNIKKKHDIYGISKYFSTAELFRYKYGNNENKLRQDFIKGKLSPEEVLLFKQLYDEQ